MTNLRVMIVDDHEIVREGLKLLLELENDIEKVMEVSSSTECFSMMSEYNPHVILMDLKMPGIDGIEAARFIKGKHPQTKVIMLTNYDNEEYVAEALNAGADGYILKNVRKDDLVESIRKVIQGQAVVDSLVTRKLINRFKNICRSAEDTSQRPILTYRELEILSYLVAGKTNKEIADTIHLSLDTIKTHLKSIYKKLRVCNRSQAVKTAIKENLVIT